MRQSPRALAVWVLWLAALAWTGLARAECGGTTQCIGVGPTEAQALLAHHGNGPATFTLAFGNQEVGTTSAAQSVFVAAVTGPAGTTAVLGAIAVGGANASEFSVAGGSCLASGPVQGGAACTILVTFKPATAGTKSATLTVPLNPPSCDTCITGREVTLTGTATTPLPTARPATISAAASTPTVLDLAAYIGGTGALTARIASAPAHGTAVITGTRVTYTPTSGYLGPDAFTYDVTDVGGTSAPATITVSVVPRADPTADAAVVGLLRAQAKTAQRFARAQIANIQSRLESLHARAETAAAPAKLAARSPGTGLAWQAQTATTPPLRTAGDASPMATGLFSALASAARTGTFNAASLNAPVDRTVGATDVWVAGQVQFGTRDQTSDSSALRFSTDGLSAGVDRRVSEKLALGIAAGFARDQTDIGADGSRARTKGSSIALYGSYQPGVNLYVDGLLGVGNLDMDSERFVAAANDFARGTRDGRQWFGSLAAGYEFRERNVLLSPYGRIDFGRARLNAYSEAGAGLAALTFFEQTLPTLQVAFGVRAESVHETDFGYALPRLRFEVRHDAKGESEARLAYADLPAGPIYGITPSMDKRTSLLLGVGSDFLLRNGLKLGVDYQIQRASGVDHNQLVRVWVAKELDGKGLPMGALDAPTLFVNPVRVETSIVWDDNVNRARESEEKLADRIYSLNVGKAASLPLGEHTRIVATGFAAGDKFARYPGLDRFSLGGQAELQYRASGEFSAPTFGLQGRLVFDEHAGQLRSGHRYSLGLTYRQGLTDRIEIFAALTANRRQADNVVFDGKDTSARVNLDYALTHSGVLYLGGEFRKGDAVTTRTDSHAYESFAKAWVPDDAYGSDPLVAYRYEAKTTLWTLGYNWALGPRDSLDFSMRRAASKPTAPASPLYPAPSRYTANQFSVAYLVRF